jgi:hypothetical protein
MVIVVYCVRACLIVSISGQIKKRNKSIVSVAVLPRPSKMVYAYKRRLALMMISFICSCRNKK